MDLPNLVKHLHIQEKLLMEIEGVIGDGEDVVKEDDLQKMLYLKAVILKKNSEDIIMDGYVVPQYGTVNFIVGDMGLDPKVWEDPMSFKLERFLSDENDGKTFDITRSKEIKMIPFGAGRRICPGHALAMLHLEYFVANPVWSFEWKAVDGDDFNMEAKQGRLKKEL
ncbi:Cytochrome P450 - like 10 [Theobroma cacao]|nr:Cytochrome P450 - like 10 [Theobroma cacao]